MPANHRHPANRQLAWERLQRGWSYEELCERVRGQMVACEETDTGLTANTVRRWETGERRPDPRYRKHLVTVFGKPASELGLLTSEELAMRPVSEVVDEIRRLLSMIAGNVDGIDRSTFLRGLLGVGVLAPLLGDGGEAVPDDGHRAVDAESAGAFADVVDRQAALYWTAPAREVYQSSVAHTGLGMRLLRTAPQGAARLTLAEAAARSALLSGRIAFFDLDDAPTAERLFRLALTATRECGDHALAAAVLAHASFVPGFAGDRASALALMDAAFAHAWHGVGPLTRAWLHCVASEISARCGEPKECMRHIDRADRMADGPGDDPHWLDFFERARLDGFAGFSALTAGHHEEAARRLGSALGDLGPNGGKQRSVLLADLAAAHAPADPERAADHLGRAVDALEETWYEVGYDRVRSLLGALPSGAVRDGIGERLTELGRARRPELIT
ncbi:helix-turn-helix transcriptional regulator [Microbispora sp. RL4-1S]|uniref:Helix-turn-helix transcriptional regulator n=1 Tax=Microbispora oryzae TaxID=2806554 RepID=A0A941AII1_9ACTN|nr:helix-turn-helix transcriptional regulator [Microbispora oryzae]MBP2703168.1 helix-turn-helix transcriptional regulator [Microbispora oryzae]